jgi:hypothetical protein
MATIWFPHYEETKQLQEAVAVSAHNYKMPTQFIKNIQRSYRQIVTFGVHYLSIM